jgi:hypothetical protein
MISLIFCSEFDKYKKISFVESIKVLISAFAVAFFLTLICGLFLTIIDKPISGLLKVDSFLNVLKNQNNKLYNTYGTKTFFLIAIYGPIIEEIIFRYHLNFKNISFAISYSLFFYLLIGGSTVNFNATNIDFYLKIISTIFLFFLLKYLFAKSNILEKLKSKYFKSYFYFISIAFGLIHISNFENIKYYMLPIYILYVLPQISMGLVLGNLRMKTGLIWAIFLHFIFNLISFIAKTLM